MLEHPFGNSYSWKMVTYHEPQFTVYPGNDSPSGIATVLGAAIAMVVYRAIGVHPVLKVLDS